MQLNTNAYINYLLGTQDKQYAKTIYEAKNLKTNDIIITQCSFDKSKDLVIQNLNKDKSLKQIFSYRFMNVYVKL